MSQQWLFKDREQAIREFHKKEKAFAIGILVLINQTVYYFEDKKEWETWKTKLFEEDYPDQYFLTNLAPWHEWLKERTKENRP